MAISEKEIKRFIGIRLGVQGGTEATRVIQNIYNQLMTIPAASRTTNDAIGNSIHTLVTNYANANRGALALSKAQDQLAKSGGMLGATLNILSSAEKGFVGVLNSISSVVGGNQIGFGVVLKDIFALNKEILVSSQSWSKYGVGVASLENTLKELRESTQLTMKESVELINAYEKGF